MCSVMDAKLLARETQVRGVRQMDLMESRRYPGAGVSSSIARRSQSCRSGVVLVVGAPQPTDDLFIAGGRPKVGRGLFCWAEQLWQVR